MTVRLYAERKGWPLRRVRARVRHDKVAGETPPDVFEREIAFDGRLDDEQRARLFEIADKCPVHRVLENGARIVTAPLVDAAPAADGASPETAPCEHYQAMDEACREAGAPG